MTVGDRRFGDGVAGIVVTFTDSGRGIAPEDLPRVFDPFFTTHPQGESVGLGLSIAHGIVASFGGRLTVTSTLGAGTCFRVELPAAPGYTMTEGGSGRFPHCEPRFGGASLWWTTTNASPAPSPCLSPTSTTPR